MHTHIHTHTHTHKQTNALRCRYMNRTPVPYSAFEYGAVPSRAIQTGRDDGQECTILSILLFVVGVDSDSDMDDAV